MIFAQILNNVVVNTIVLDDITLVPYFSQGYDYCLEIDNITDANGNVINISWYYDSNVNIFWPPIIGYPFPTSLPFPTIYQTIIDLNINFGNSIIAQMNADAAAAGISQAGKTTNWLNYLQPLYLLLQNGFLLDAINEYTAMINDISLTKTTLSPFVTNTNLTAYQTLVQNWINQS